MNNLQTIREKVIAVVPEITTLKFGCEFVVLNENVSQEESTHFILHVSQHHPFWFEAKTDGTDGKYLDFNKSEVQILGRPIRLADVLLAVDKLLYIEIEGGRTHPENMFVNCKGDFILETGLILGRWNLREDDLSKQSEETLKFLAELLNQQMK